MVDWGPYPEKDEEHYDYQTADWAIAKMKAKPQEPFCLAVGFSLPHVLVMRRKSGSIYILIKKLFYPVAKTRSRRCAALCWYLHWQLPEPRLKYLVENKQWLPLVRAYLASVSFMDAQVGRLLQTLEENGLADNTIVVLWGDHGWHLGEKDITGKNTLWERSTRVPLIFAGPGVSKNVSRTSPAELLDIYPTLSDLCGLPARRDLEGHSLVPQLQTEPVKREHPAITSHGPGNHTVRTERWRYIRYADQSEELYDMQADPNEWTNLASRTEHSALKQELAAWMPKHPAPPAPGSKSRLIELQDDGVYWENEEDYEQGAIPD